MNYRKIIITSAIGIPLILGGCFNMNEKTGTDHKTAKQSQNSNVRLEDYVRVQDYTGQGYKLAYGEENDKIAKAHRKEIDRAVKEFFLKKYKTNVIVHNMVGNRDGVTVFVESIGEPHFHTFAIVPIASNSEIITDDVWSQEGQVEDAIGTGIYAMIFDKEFTKLDQFLESFVKGHPVVGERIEAINNTGAEGYSTSYYYTSSAKETWGLLFNKYMENPKRTKNEWKALFNRNSFDPKNFSIAIALYMAKKNTNPDPAILNQLVADLEKMDGLPTGTYSIYLNDNTLDKTTGTNSKNSTLERADPNPIIK